MTASAAPLLQTEGLRLRAGRRTLVDALALTVRPGELWCVLGPNGSGKTTLLHTLAGLRAAEEGQVALGGRPVGDWPIGELACLRGLLPQALHDAFAARVIEVVLTGRHPHLARWAWEGEADRAIAQAALRAVDLEALAGRDVTTLSGGERQRVGIATLLAQDPLLLLLDEPVAHLDLHHQHTVLEHLRGWVGHPGRAALVALHDLNLAARYATHALVLGGPQPVLGPAERVLDAAILGAAFGHALVREQFGGRPVFIPQ